MANFSTVEDSVRDLFGDEAGNVISDMESARESRRIVGFLIQTRVTEGLRQCDIARRMGVSASTISRMEDSADAELKYGEIQAYLHALGLGFSFDAGVTGSPRRPPKPSHGNLGRRRSQLATLA